MSEFKGFNESIVGNFTTVDVLEIEGEQRSCNLAGDGTEAADVIEIGRAHV